MQELQSRQRKQAEDCLAVLQAEIDTGLGHINSLCTTEGKFSVSQLDAHQKVSYELAFCSAELEASKVLLKYADKVSAQDSLTIKMSLAFCADSLRTVWQRLLAHSVEAGLSNPRLLGQMGSEPLAGFLAEHGDVTQFAAIGAELLQRGSVHLPSGLGGRKRYD